MLLNFWYAVEASALITQTPKKLRLLGQDLVLYRGEDGKAVALRDLCPHRGAPLSMGHVEGSCIRCPYHGWVFDGQGHCIEIPANPSTLRIPKKAVVDSYPVEERYGWMWVFMGDLPEKDRPPIPQIDYYGQPGWRSMHGEFLWKANYERVVENGMDIAHTPFVHQNSFGNREQPEVKDHEVHTTEYSAWATTTLMPPMPKGIWRFLRKERQPVTATVGFYMPNLTRLELDFGKWRTVLIDSNLPVDEYTTLTKYLQMRNFFTGAWADRDASRRLMKIFNEDVAVVEAVKPELLPHDLSAELHLRSDALSIAYRKTRQRFLDMGWGVSSQKSDGHIVPSIRRSAV